MTTPIARDEVQKLAARFSYLGNHRSGEPLLEVVYADPGNNGFYYREEKPDSVTCYVRIDTFARTVIALHAQLADAQAAQAMVVVTIQDAVQKLRREAAGNADGVRFQALDDVRHLIRALAPIDGLALVRELRAERGAFEGNAKDAYERWVAERDRAEKAEAIAQRFADRHEKHLQIGAELRAERDRIAATNAVLEAKVAGLVEALGDLRQWCNAYPVAVFPEPDLKCVAEVLKDAGLTLDAVSASNFRHVLKRVREITDAALLPVARCQHDDGVV